MSNFVSVDDVKAQCRIDPDDTSENGLLQIYADVAEETVFNLIGRSAIEVIDEWSEVPAPLKGAMLMIAGQCYKYREASTSEAANRVPYGVQCMLSPYVKLS